jgi:hypothetical protein
MQTEISEMKAVFKGDRNVGSIGKHKNLNNWTFIAVTRVLASCCWWF